MADSHGIFNMQLFYGVSKDTEKRMSLVTQIRGIFPDLETKEKLTGQTDISMVCRK